MKRKCRYKYCDYKTLANNYTLGTHFEIIRKQRDSSNLLVIAPHGGKIEKGTSQIAKAVAGKVHSIYIFEGLLHKDNLYLLHITSHKFDEPNALKLCGKHEFALGIHGRADKIEGLDKPDGETIFLGGLNRNFIALLAKNLHMHGYKVLTEGHPFPATHQSNICNRCSSGKGAQMEIPRTLRDNLSHDETKLSHFSIAVQTAIDELMSG